MASKRDYITEIVQKRSRLLKRVGRWKLFSTRYEQVLSAFEYLRKSKDASLAARQELLKYVPMGTVACLEAYYRMVIRDLIDHGAPYNANAHKLEDIKLDVATVLGMGL